MCDQTWPVKLSLLLASRAKGVAALTGRPDLGESVGMALNDRPSLADRIETAADEHRIVAVGVFERTAACFGHGVVSGVGRRQRQMSIRDSSNASCA